MRTKLINKSQQGFTIIEIMIVLAIAGLIMLIVFLAVPALQRSARNTSRKNDAGNFSSQLSTWISNNNGDLPGTELPGTTYSQNQCNTDVTDIASNSIKLGYYTPSDFSCAPSPSYTGAEINACQSSGTQAGTTCVGTENVVVDEGVVCNSPLQPQQAMVTTNGASTRSYVVLYAVENGNSGLSPQCIGG